MPELRAIRLSLEAWLTTVLVAWVTIHALNVWLPITTTSSGEGVTLLFWTAAKLLAWILPSALFLWTHPGASLRWVGLSETRGLAVAALWSAAWILLQAAGHRLLPGRLQSDLVFYRLVNALVIAPIFEELLFRGVMLRALRDAGTSRERAVLWSALAFGALHLPGWVAVRGLDPGIVGSFLGIVGFGIVLGYLAWRTPSLWAPILLHAANNWLSSGVFAWLGLPLG